jgi:hypothetical protein
LSAQDFRFKGIACPHNPGSRHEISTLRKPPFCHAARETLFLRPFYLPGTATFRRKQPLKRAPALKNAALHHILF